MHTMDNSSFSHRNGPRSNGSSLEQQIYADVSQKKVSFGEFVTLMWALEADHLKKQKIFAGASSN